MINWLLKRKIKKELMEKRALPMGVKEFHEWSDRIISAANIPGASAASQKFALAEDVVHLPPGTDFECDAYFAKRLKKFAINQVCLQMAQDIRKEEKARIAKEEQEKVAISTNETQVLAN